MSINSGISDMLQGFVNEYGEPIVSLELVSGNELVDNSAVIDTGFNGYLSISKNVLKRLDWQFIGYEEYELANGTRFKEKIYLGRIVFDGEAHEVLVVATDSEDALIGTKLLKEKILTINFRMNMIEIVDADVEIAE